MEFDEIDEMPERYENDLEEFELNQLANDPSTSRPSTTRRRSVTRSRRASCWTSSQLTEGRGRNRGPPLQAIATSRRGAHVRHIPDRWPGA